MSRPLLEKVIAVSRFTKVGTDSELGVSIPKTEHLSTESIERIESMLIKAAMELGNKAVGIAANQLPEIIEYCNDHHLPAK